MLKSANVRLQNAASYDKFGFLQKLLIILKLILLFDLNLMESRPLYMHCLYNKIKKQEWANFSCSLQQKSRPNSQKTKPFFMHTATVKQSHKLTRAYETNDNV